MRTRTPVWVGNFRLTLVVYVLLPQDSSRKLSCAAACYECNQVGLIWLDILVESILLLEAGAGVYAGVFAQHQRAFLS